MPRCCASASPSTWTTLSGRPSGAFSLFRKRTYRFSFKTKVWNWIGRRQTWHISCEEGIIFLTKNKLWQLIWWNSIDISIWERCTRWNTLWISKADKCSTMFQCLQCLTWVFGLKVRFRYSWVWTVQSLGIPPFFHAAMYSSTVFSELGTTYSC